MTNVIGYVVKHKNSGVVYAIQTSQFDPKIHDKIRDMLPGESVSKYRPHRGDGSRPAGVKNSTSLIQKWMRMAEEISNTDTKNKEESSSKDDSAKKEKK